MNTQVYYKDVYAGLHDEAVLWATGLVLRAPGKNARLHVKPTKVLIVKYDNSWTGHPSYSYRIIVLNKKGEKTNKSLNFDGSLFLYENEHDCIHKYSELNKEVLARFENWWALQLIWAQKKIEEYKKHIK